MMDKRVGIPNIGNIELFRRYTDAIFSNGILTNNGPLVQELENRLADYLNVDHCIVTCNGTTALEIAIKSLGLTGEVIVPSFTFIASAHALSWLGITPVFADIKLSDLTIDENDVETKITPRTTAILGVHLFGRPCNIQALQLLADQHKIQLFFDSAHAFGCTYHGQSIANFGECEVFSFHATKIFNTFEGGAITTNNKALAHKIRLMRNFGFVDYDTTDSLGINGKMTEIAAAMGLTNLASVDTFIKHNAVNHHTYCQALQHSKSFHILCYDTQEKHNYQYVTAICQSTLEREKAIECLQQYGVMARRYFYPGAHKMSPYHTFDRLPNTDYIANRILILPTGQSVTQEDIMQIADVLGAI